jgi:hypothetical protein
LLCDAQDVVGQSTCKSCPAQTQPGQVTCPGGCVPGKRNVNGNCVDCLQGFYQDQFNKTICLGACAFRPLELVLFP